MGRILRLAVLVAAAALAFPAAAFAGAVTLHPSGFGEKSYAAWKAQQGLPDRTGNDQQSLYFQKNTLTSTFAAGVAVFKGFTNVPLSQLDGLSFWVRRDGHCGAGAPRFNVRFQPPTGPRQTFFIGCAGMAITDTTTFCPKGVDATSNPLGCEWEERSFPGGGAFGFNTGSGNTETVFPAGTVTSLAMVFDEGFDQGRCEGQLGSVSQRSCTFTDNIEILTSTTEFGDKCWTGASDNGNQNSGPCPTNPTMPNSVALGLSSLTLDPPTIEERLDVFPDVDPLAWVFYPNVLY
jgi:hypothetical protein